MDNTRQQIVDSIKANSNILVTVSDSPSVDELSAALGLTILLNNLDKRATAVFSGAVPPAISFLEPAKTFEDTADSLRDFIIALDKEKADHLRYKVDGDVVKIFITPYRTTLSQNDLEFSQGDYNVELVVAIGVKDQNHLDKALAAHGKILHDATVVTVTAGSDTSSLGTVDWHDAAASSLSEMVVSLADGLKTDKTLLDEQISTAFLTGIVSATDRFSNDRTSSRVMTMAAQLMAAGANQQLIAAKLEEAHDIEPRTAKSDAADKIDAKAEEATKTDGSELSITRSDRKESKNDTQESSDVKATTEDAVNAELEAKQQELEAELAAVTAPAAPSLGDIEKELKAATEVPQEATPPAEPSPAPEPVITDPALVAPTDAAMPSFEPTGVNELPAQPESVTPPLPPLPELPPELTPPIINDHGSFTDVPPSTTQPINSTNAGPSADDLMVDPFAAATATVATETPLVLTPPPNDLAQPGVGTPEGAVQLSAPPIEPIALPEPVQQPAPEPVVPTLPPLPPLPPLPTDGSLPPLPPPPPLPDFGQNVAMPSGAVSGDVFGDASSTAAPEQSAAPAGPGQFKIPGQN